MNWDDDGGGEGFYVIKNAMNSVLEYLKNVKASQNKIKTKNKINQTRGTQTKINNVCSMIELHTTMLVCME